MTQSTSDKTFQKNANKKKTENYETEDIKN